MQRIFNYLDHIVQARARDAAMRCRTRSIWVQPPG